MWPFLWRGFHHHIMAAHIAQLLRQQVAQAQRDRFFTLRQQRTVDLNLL
ncbi:hypothetical protein ACZ87_00674 [Candidatus Erwinia dacicola]|uniref:Uncharacterized protein n=1 Tax=Candidatus Erwinia dacicola TaxID=252393 RepID=A0A328TTT8_9GAMM|nr:hypothetical protein ACZ87_00674 [Candidatus Erwinia dacicola]